MIAEFKQRCAVKMEKIGGGEWRKFEFEKEIVASTENSL